MTMYPNPSKGLVFLSFNQQIAKEMAVSVIDLKGQVMMSKAFTPNTGALELDLSSLKNGLYIISVIGDP